jgi:hypothetical protein
MDVNALYRIAGQANLSPKRVSSPIATLPFVIL